MVAPMQAITALVVSAAGCLLPVVSRCHIIIASKTMKKIYFTIIMLAALAMVSCDEVSHENRLIYIEPPEVGRAVLIEDYTGQYCVNCPRATEEIERLVSEYGDSVVIAVAIHSGPFSKNKGELSPLYTEVGDMYFNAWGLSSVMCVDITGQVHTGISEVTNSEPVKTEIFTVDGRRVNQMEEGVNIIRTTDANGNVTTKKVLK